MIRKSPYYTPETWQQRALQVLIRGIDEDEEEEDEDDVDMDVDEDVD